MGYFFETRLGVYLGIPLALSGMILAAFVSDAFCVLMPIGGSLIGIGLASATWRKRRVLFEKYCADFERALNSQKPAA